MDRIIYTGMTGASQVLSQQAAMAHNMANATTAGYRAEMHAFLAVPIEGPGLPTRALVVDASVMNDFTPGLLRQTERPLDVAVQGDGLIALAMPDGKEAYTRNGSLEVNASGVLQTRTGIPLRGTAGIITLPPGADVSIGKDGSISATSRSDAQGAPAVVGRMKLVKPHVHSLERGADGLFRLPDGQAAHASADVSLAPGYLEDGNVNMASEMVSMISQARQFALQMKVMSSAEENDRQATTLLALTR